MKKRICCFLSVLLAILFCSGCSSQPVMDLSGFADTMESAGYEVTMEASARKEGICDAVCVARRADSVNMDYYQMASEEQAEILFFHIQKQVEEMFTGQMLKMTLTATLPHSSAYKTHAPDYVITIYRRENVVVYGRAVKDQEEAMNSLLEDMGF